MPQRSALRLFVALYPPPGVSGAMLALLDGLLLPKHRAVRAEQVHLTLFFAGDTDPRQLDEVLESVRRSAAGLGAITLTPSEIVSLPEQGKPRLVALATEAPPGLIELQRRLAHRLSRRPRRTSGERFLPHFTLARFEVPGGEPVRAPAVLAPFVVWHAALVQSVLKAGGAEHRVLDRVALAAPSKARSNE